MSVEELRLKVLELAVVLQGSNDDPDNVLMRAEELYEFIETGNVAARNVVEE